MRLELYKAYRQCHGSLPLLKEASPSCPLHLSNALIHFLPTNTFFLTQREKHKFIPLIAKSRRSAVESQVDLRRCQFPITHAMYVVLVFISMYLFYSFSFLWGPWAHVKHLLSCGRLPFTICYLGTVIGTLYSALIVSNSGRPVKVVMERAR